MTEKAEQQLTRLAFPAPDAQQEACLTKTEYFAAVAMHSLLLTDRGISTDRLVIDAYNIAQAMARRAEALAAGLHA
ncbi:MAG TPA: hypothetical protein VFF69_04895 [Phycisphaerales bacterium]|nr:hypothetical protein [Phycisphaerales bacterium]